MLTIYFFQSLFTRLAIFQTLPIYDFLGHNITSYHRVGGLVGRKVDGGNVVKVGTEGEGGYFEEGMGGGVLSQARILLLSSSSPK